MRLALVFGLALLALVGLVRPADGEEATVVDSPVVKVDAKFKSDKVEIKAEIFIPADKAAEEKLGMVAACKDRALLALEAAKIEVEKKIAELKAEKEVREKKAAETTKPPIKGSYISEPYVVVGGKRMSVPEYNLLAERQPQGR